jgi:uncharacterized DUF497 family protein
MRWTWDPEKNLFNQDKHRISFETAQLVFNDPLAVTYPDIYPYKSRWRTIGVVNSLTLMVIYAWPENYPDTDEPIGRIISARVATRQERRDYEEGHLT